jgi:UDP-N-acetylglucosamine acyltransferase
MQGGSAISKDLPPFTVARRGENALGGLNSVGLRRAGFSSQERLELKRLYHALFASGLGLRDALAQARASVSSAAAKTLLDFVAESKRGVCTAKGQAGDDGNAPADGPDHL